MIKHAHQDFPSDIFVILEALGASITLGMKLSCNMTLYF